MHRVKCILSSSPSQRCLDRFSILDPSDEDQEGTVSTWALIRKLLHSPVTSSSALVDILESISVTIRDSTGRAGDYGTLRKVVEASGRSAAFFSKTWPAIVAAALAMPRLFPGHDLLKLTPGEKLRLSRAQCASLVAHQFLCTYDVPREDFFDFSVWYGSEQRHPAAVEMYLEALFTHFDTLDLPNENTYRHEDDNHVIEYSLYVLAPLDSYKLQDLSKTPLHAIHVVQVDKYSTQQQEYNHQYPDSAVVISANKDIGFGQSATQEELHMGNSPEACAAVLFTPRLAADQVLVIQGAAPMLRIEGQRRDIVWRRLDPEERRGGRMLLMDALEMDEASGADNDGGLPDLLDANIERELLKAYTAFASWHSTAVVPTVWSGLWGCGAFNGEPAVKALILWIAASLAGKELKLVLDSSEALFAARLSRIAAMKFVGPRAK
ncbi:hypothetical protein K4F52_000538 [Lecanicillium sp. MT-2017a]|nr:hypothetical protein K4F52_000538 [Lecanicillium sp. MT-2017a]